MKQFINRKPVSLAIGVFSILFLVLLAGSIDSLEFKKGTPFTYSTVNEVDETLTIEPPDLGWVAIVVIAIFLILSIFLLIFATPKQRRLLLLILLAVAVVLLGIMWWTSSGNSGNAQLTPTSLPIRTPADPDELSIQTGTQPPGLVYTPPGISPWISIGITFFTLLILALLGWYFLRQRWRQDRSLDDLAGIAEQAVGGLQSGKDYGDIIINCYARMVESITKMRGIRRRGNLTPKEFIAVLERAGLPSDPIRRLTTLFESVRYGKIRTTRGEITEAVECLNDIVDSIREGR